MSSSTAKNEEPNEADEAAKKSGAGKIAKSEKWENAVLQNQIKRDKGKYEKSEHFEKWKR